MAEISVLPLAPSQAGAEHLLSLLAEAAASGRDLGSRVPHMQQNARALERLAGVLDERVRMLHQILDASPIPPAETAAAMAHLDKVVRNARELAQTVGEL